MLDHHLDRLQGLNVPVILATTTGATDDPIVRLGESRGVVVFRGSESDVLSRFAGAAAAYNLDVVVRVTSDCPLIDAGLIQQGIQRYLELDDPYAHVSNVLERTYPRGFDFEVFSASALADADLRATDPADREHVTPFLYTGRSGRAHLHAITAEIDASRFRVTLDTQEDLVVLRTLIEEHGAATLDASAIIALLERLPDLMHVNTHVEQKKLGE